MLVATSQKRILSAKNRKKNNLHYKELRCCHFFNIIHESCFYQKRIKNEVLDGRLREVNLHPHSPGCIHNVIAHHLARSSHSSQEA